MLFISYYHVGLCNVSHHQLSPPFPQSQNQWHEAAIERRTRCQRHRLSRKRRAGSHSQPYTPDHWRIE